jgi:dTMP kinase
MKRGFLIALEGVDGSGKTTQARLLAAALKDRGLKVVLTREPTDGPHGEQLRRYLAGPARHLSAAAELELFTADRRDHVRQVISPGLAAGLIIISDRYYYSSVAYQGALGLDPGAILALNQAFAPPPDLVFILTLPISRAIARLSATPGRERQVSEVADYLEKVAAIYAGLQGPRFHHLDAARPQEAIHAHILTLTLKALGE